MEDSGKKTIWLLMLVVPGLGIILGAMVLVGWIFNVDSLIRILPSLSGMNPLTASLFILLSFSILLSGISQRNGKVSLRPAVRIAVSLVFLIAVLRLIDILTGGSLGVDLIVFKERIINPDTPPARMALATTICFLALSFSVFTLSYPGRLRFLALSRTGLLIVFLVAGPALFFYLGRNTVFLQVPLYFSMALHTTLLFLALAAMQTICLRLAHRARGFLYDPRLIVLLLFVFIPVWVFFVAPEITKLPDNFSYEAEILSVDNFYDEETGAYAGEILSNTNFSYEVESVQGRVLNIRNAFDVSTPTGEEIFSVERNYGIDAYTGAHVKGYGDHDREGYLFAPRNLNQEDFVYWHVNYDEPALMKFQGEEEINGLKVYRYEADFGADQTADLTNLPEVGKTRGINLDIHLKLWVEPRTGRMIKYEDQTIAYYYDLATGERLHPWNKFSNKFSSSAVDEQVLLARQQIQQLVFVEKMMPIALMVLALVGLLALLLLRYSKGATALLLPALVLLTSLGGTIFVWRYTQSSVDLQARNKFERETAVMEDLVLERMEIYANALAAGKGLFLSSQEVSRAGWRRFVEGVNIQKNYPGVQGLGYAIVLRPDEVADFEARIREEGFAEFKVFPEGERDVYTAIQFLEPFDFRNQRAFGYDMFSEETRRQGMEYARDNDAPAITGKVLLLQETEEDIQSGFLMYVPLYAEGVPMETPEERERALLGYVYSPFRMRDLMQAALFHQSYQIDTEVFDGGAVTEEGEMYDDDKGEFSRDKDYTARFEKTQTIDLYGHAWTFKFVSLPDYGLGNFQESYPGLVLRLGVVLSILLAGITYSLASSRARAVKLADEMTVDLKAKTKDLEEEKGKVEAILAGVGEGLTATDGQGNIIVANRAFENILGWRSDEVIGKKMYEAIPMEDGEGRRIPKQKRPLSIVLGSGQKIVDGSKYYIRKDQTKVPVNISVTPIVVDGQVRGIIEVFRDITKEKEVDRMKTEFLSLASHQLRTPLAAMKWFLEILLDNSIGKLSDKQKEMAQKIEQSNNRMIELVNSLLNVSRLEQGRIMVEPESVDLKRLLDEVLTELTAEVRAKEQQVVKSYPSEKLVVKVDPKLIRQVYLNLVGNAVKYSPSGKTVKVSMAIKGEEVIFQVADQGYGIPKDEQDKIFEKFYRASNVITKETDGNGLGLYLTQQIVAASGGRLWFESEEGKGSTFGFALPLAGSKMKKGEKSLV